MRNKALFKFTNFSRKQKMVLEWWCPDSPYADKDGIICDGSIRAGKTTAMAMSFVFWAMDTFDECNLALCGKTINSLRRNVIKQLTRVLISRGYQVQEHRSENYITISLGDTSNDFYLFGGKDESSQDLIQGITLAGVFFDEVSLMPESFVNQAVGRCSVEGSKFWFNCNPDSPNHYFKENWIDKLTEKNLIRIHFTMEDNPSLSKKTIDRYKSLFVGVFYDRFILGLWVMAQGLIYPKYQEALVDSLPDGKKENDIISIDYGTMNAFAAILWSKYGNTWYGHKNYYYSGRDTGIQKTDDEYLKDIEDKFADVINEYKGKVKEYSKYGGMPPQKIKVIIDPSAASFIALLRKTDWAKVIPADNAVLDGIRETASTMNLGIIKIVDNKDMEPWKKEAGGYVWDEKAVDDKPVKVDDHCLTGDTLVMTEYGAKPIKELVGTSGNVWSYNTKTGCAELKPYHDCRLTQEMADIYEIETEDGRVIRCTGEHPILTQRGFILAKYLEVSDKIIDIMDAISYNIDKS